MQILSGRLFLLSTCISLGGLYVLMHFFIPSLPPPLEGLVVMTTNAIGILSGALGAGVVLVRERERGASALTGLALMVLGGAISAGGALAFGAGSGLLGLALGAAGLVLATVGLSIIGRW